MQQNRVTVLVACLSVLFTLVSSTAQSPAGDVQGDAVRRLSNDEVEAFLQRDPHALARLWSDDFVVTNPLNKIADKQQVLEMIRSGFLEITSFSRQVEYAQTYGDTVILAGTEHVVWGGRMPNAGNPELLRFTAVWRKQHGMWREIARHANIVPVQQERNHLEKPR